MNELLSENSLIFEHMFQYTPVGIAIISPENGAWIKINPALCLMLGYSESELLAMSYLDITYPDDAHIDHSLIVGKIAEESSLSYEFEKRYVHQNGSIIWVSMHISLVLDEQTREPLYYIAQVIDISEKKEAEQKLIENHKLFQLIDDNALDLITSSKPDGTLLYCSPSIFTLLGYTQEEMLGTNRMDYYHPDDQEKLIGAHYYPNNMF
jgi:PAS domain S-box-containing protein